MTAAPPEEHDLLHWRISPRAFFWRCVALAVLTTEAARRYLNFIEMIPSSR